MAAFDGKRCDRCGQLFEGYIGKIAYGAICPNTMVLRDCYIDTKAERVDLCPECMGKLIEFLKEAQE